MFPRLTWRAWGGGGVITVDISASVYECDTWQFCGLDIPILKFGYVKKLSYAGWGTPPE